MRKKQTEIVKIFFKYLIYVSVIFLVVALIKADYLRIPVVYDYSFLFLSVILLFVGFVFQGLNWYAVLKKDFPISVKDAVISFGLYVFTKYIPGKILVIISKAGYIKEKYDYPLNSLISRSLDAQFIVLWSGISIGSIGFLFSENTLNKGIPLFIAWIVLSLIIFTNIFHKLFKKTVKRITKKDLNIPLIPFKEVLKILPVYFGYWIIFSAAFYFFASALSSDPISIGISFGFPLSITAGIIVLIAPGGIGVREGFLAAFLILLGLNTGEATTISVASRLWFLSGEIFMFVTAVILNRFRGN